MEIQLKTSFYGSYSGQKIADDSDGKYLSEALIFASINPQYDDILFMELQVQWTILSYCGLVDAGISASEKKICVLT